ncbi:hypothetical protein BJY04DRAFT_207364 [Aspergillus karnatakaensis]|uniref:TauD/TfdA dioxygenase family protein n=1 Tax=Aspergillus karnatakaensis TaxID=1810916 RepID=UPI003CCD8CE9
MVAEAEPKTQIVFQNGVKPKIRRAIDEEGGTTDASYPHYLPIWDYTEKYPPLEPFTHHDPGHDADPSLTDLLTGAKTKKLTPLMGTEISGVQISRLSKSGKDQLALFAAQRKVLVFRDQDFADLPIQKALDFGSHFGRHHIHPTTGCPEGYPEVNLVHQKRSANGEYDLFVSGKNSTVLWHSDVTYEEQPPGTTIMYMLDTPEVGGDTAFVDQVEAYRRLSPVLRERLHGLRALHSGVEQAEASAKGGGIVRREGIVTEHPVVRTHPVTGEKALFVNALATKIVGMKKEESDALLAFLNTHIGRGLEYQVRVKWEPKTVIVWDNRVTAHTAIVDWTSTERRHLARITPQAERPFETPYNPDEEHW